MLNLRCKAFVMLVLMLLATICPVCAIDPIAMPLSDSEIAEALLAQGVPQSFLENRTSEELRYFYENIGGCKIVCFDTQTGTAETAQGVEPRGEIAADRLSFTVTTVGITDTITEEDIYSDEIDRMWVFIEYDWAAGYPVYLWDDAITVNWDYSKFVYKSDSFESSDSYYSEARGQWVEYYHSTTYDPTDLDLGGL